MLSFLIGLGVLIFVAKMIKAEKKIPPSSYDKTPDNKKMTFEEWDYLDSNGKEPELTRREWEALEKEEKITKGEYEAELLLCNNCNSCV